MQRPLPRLPRFPSSSPRGRWLQGRLARQAGRRGRRSRPSVVNKRLAGGGGGDNGQVTATRTFRNRCNGAPLAGRPGTPPGPRYSPTRPERSSLSRSEKRRRLSGRETSALAGHPSFFCKPSLACGAQFSAPPSCQLHPAPTRRDAPHLLPQPSAKILQMSQPAAPRLWGGRATGPDFGGNLLKVSGGPSPPGNVLQPSLQRGPLDLLRI